MKLNNIKAAYSIANTLYGVNVGEDEFEDLALHAWQLIGNRHTRLYRYTACTKNKRLVLPCNADFIEAVTIPAEDAQVSSNKSDTPLFENTYVEHRAEHDKWNTNSLYVSGKLVSYREEDGELVFDRDYHAVTVLYHGVLVDDEDGLPKVTDKELTAVAAYVAYSSMYKQSLILKNANIMQMAQVLKADWLRACNDARVPAYVSQNEMNDILDVMTRWDRKSYGKSYKKYN